MMNYADIGLTNTFLPLAGLVAVALLLPFVLVPHGTRSQARLAGGMVLTGALTFGAALGLFALGMVSRPVVGWKKGLMWSMAACEASPMRTL